MCNAIKGVPGLLDGWACCGKEGKCKTYNGDIRSECKWCNQSRCASSETDTKQVPFQKENGKVIVQTIKVPNKEGGGLN